MSLNKLHLPATFALLTLAATLAHGACTQWSGTTSFTGSTTGFGELNHYTTSTANRVNSESCSWDITCPVGSFIGATDFDFMLYTGDAVTFVDIDGTPSTLDTWSTAVSGVSSGFTRANRKFLFASTNKLRVDYTTASTGSVGYGFKLQYMCFTDTCPAQLMSKKTYGSTEKSGFEFHNPVVAGTSCTFNFACAATTDRPQLIHMRGSTLFNSATMTIAGTSPTSSYSVPMTSTTSANYQLDAATSYTVTYTAPTGSASSLDLGFTSAGAYHTEFITAWAGCQAPSESVCLSNLHRNGAILSTYGTVATDPDGASISNLATTKVVNNCEYQVQCPAGATGILFTGSLNSATYGTIQVRSSPGGSADMTFSSTTTVPFTFAGTSAYVYIGTTSTTGFSGGHVTYSCTYSKCYTSPQSGLHTQTKALTATSLKTDTEIPQTTETQAFMSDEDGSGVVRDLLSSQSGQVCEFSVTCPSGYFVMLNVTGKLVSGASFDRIYATGGGKFYDYSFPVSSSSSFTTYYQSVTGQSVITAANSLTWTQSANYQVYGDGYTVDAGCTSFVAGTCPYTTEASQFSSLSSASLNTDVVLDTTVISMGNPRIPAGYSCSWPITCPANSYVKVVQGTGFASSYVHVPIWSSGSSALAVSKNPGTYYLGVQTVNLAWETTQWNTTSSFYNSGFYVTVSCTSDITAPTPAPATPTPFTPIPITGNSICSEYTGAHTLAGSTSYTQTLDHFHTSSYKRHNGNRCVWDISCPTGSFIGFTDLDFRVYDNDFLEFVDTDVSDHWVPLDTWSTNLPWVSSYYTQANLKGLYPNTNKMRVAYNTTTSGTTGYGFRLAYKCYTSTCPSDFATYSTSSTAAQSSFKVSGEPVFGTSCSFTFSCQDTTDVPKLSYTRGSSSNPATLTVTGSSPSSTYTVPATTGSGTATLDAATSYTVNLALSGLPSQTSYPHYSTSAASANVFTAWAGCQASTETSCPNVIRNGATLSNGYGVISSDPDGASTTSSNAVLTGITACEFHVSCPTGASSIKFTGSLYSSSYGQLYVRATSGGAYSKSWTSSSTSTYSYSGTDAYVYLASTSATSSLTGAALTYSCTYAECYSSSEAGLHTQTKALTATTLKTDTLIPQTTETQVFNSDSDGVNALSQLSSSESGQKCQFAVSCPTGYYVMLNISGRLVTNVDASKNDRILATGGGKTYDFSFKNTYSSSSSTYYEAIAADAAFSIITSANTLSWSQSAHYYVAGYGYTVKAGCTSFVAGSCPMSTGHFSSLSTAALTTSVTLDTYVTSSSSPTVPVGYKCDFPITCPTGSYIQIVQSSGLLYYSGNPNRPVLKDSNGNTLPWSSSSSTVIFDVASATLTWETKQWNVTMSTYLRGFKVFVSCTSTGGSSPSTSAPYTPIPITGNSVCSEYTGAHALAGSTSYTQTLDHYHTSSYNRHNGNRCVWDISCPTGSFIGFTDLDFMLYTNDFLEFVDTDTNNWVPLDTWSTYLSWVSSNGASKTNHKGLYPNTNKMRVAYNTTTSGTTGYGFRLAYKCYTSTCPSDLVHFKTSATAAQSSFEVHTRPVAGTSCSFSFSCPLSTDRPRLTYTRGSYSNPASLRVAGNNPSSNYTVGVSTGSRQLSAAQSFTVTYGGTGDNASLAYQGYYSNAASSGSTQYFTVWAGCQASTETSCPNVIRNGATLSNGYGVISSDPDGASTTSSNAVLKGVKSCEYKISCPSSASIKFMGSIYSSSYGALYIRNSAGGSYTKRFTSSSSSAYTYTGSAAYVYIAATSSTYALTGASLTYSCAYAQCSASMQSGLHLQTVSLPSTSLMTNTWIPQTTSTQNFYSDEDGSSSTYKISSLQSGQNCKFAVSCPTGYYVMLNVSGSLVSSNGGTDRIVATGGGKTYDFSFPSSYNSQTLYNEASVITESQNLTWTQSAHYYSYSYGYKVEAGCTSFKAGTCPLSGAASHFAPLTTGNLTSKALDTYVSSSSSPSIPVGFKCAFPISCPTGKFIYVTLSSGLYGYSSNPNQPTFTNSFGEKISLTSYSSTNYLGVNSATLTWETKQWNVTSSTYHRGFYMTVGCSSTTGPSTPTPAIPFFATPTPAPSSSFIGPCHYAQTTWALTEQVNIDESTRHRMVFDWSSNTGYTECDLVFTCPSTSYGMAVKLTKKDSSNRLHVRVNASTIKVLPTSDDYVSSSSTYLSDSYATDLVVGRRKGLKITAWGDRGSFAMQATCLTTSKVPTNSYDVNYESKTYNPPSSSSYSYASYVYTYSSSNKQYTPIVLGYGVGRRAYGELERRAFLISCGTDDMTSRNYVASLMSVSGGTGSGDLLEVIAVDSGISKTFSGTVSSTYDRGNNTAGFSASSQYYMVWTSDTYSESSTGLVVAYYCEEASWKITGVGTSVADDPGITSGASTVTLTALAIAVLAALM